MSNRQLFSYIDSFVLICVCYDVTRSRYYIIIIDFPGWTLGRIRSKEIIRIRHIMLLISRSWKSIDVR